MIDAINVKVGPQFYRYSEGALDLIPELFEEFDVKRVMVIHGTVSWDKAQPYLTALSNHSSVVHYERYSGECSYNEGNRIATLVKEHNIDFIVGVGGGKLADVVLYASHLANVQFGVVPTLASNCAAWTPLSVMYKDNGLAEGKTEHVKRQAAFLLMDPRLAIDSPIEYFIAGIADTLAKWYESDMILEQDSFSKEPFPMMARHAAKMCKDVILEEASKAIEDMNNGTVTAEFIHVSEIIVAVAGLVGGLGDKYARNTAAHAMHDAISAYLPEVHKYLHGEKVAYGIFYQLALEEKWAVIDELLPLYQELSLPMSLTQMGVYPMDDETLTDIISLVNGKQKVHLLPMEINETVLTKALVELEEYLNNKEVI